MSNGSFFFIIKLVMEKINTPGNARDVFTPKTESFIDEVYPSEEVKADTTLLKAFKRTPEYTKSVEGNYAEIMENFITESIADEDWMLEDDIYGDDPDFEVLHAIPTNEIDDCFNHIDIICTISNECTGNKKMPFALDATYNTSLDGIKKKFKRRHVYGKKENAPCESEFGSYRVETNAAGYQFITTRPLPERFREGMKIPGFTSAKYFEDTDSTGFELDAIEKGRIPVMPRFVVGFEPTLLDELSSKPRRESPTYLSDMKKYNGYMRRAQCCIVRELFAQADGLLGFLENLPEDKKRWFDPEEYETAKAQAAAMKEYCKKSLDRIYELAETDESYREGLKYADHDSVCGAIEIQSDMTYGARDNIRMTSHERQNLIA